MYGLPAAISSVPPGDSHGQAYSVESPQMLRRFLFNLVLEDAIGREEKAYRFYEAAAAAARLPEAAQLLARLCAEELRHRVRLEHLKSLGELPEVRLADPAETSVAAPAGEPPAGEPENPLPALTEEGTAETILAVALVKELKSVRYYEVLTRRGPLRAVRDLFRRLATEEREHVRLVRQWQAQREGGERAG
jgi:rubrerythrin